MRKLFWGLTTVAVATVGGMVWLKWQGPGLPYTFAATAAVKCCECAPGGTLLVGTLTGGAGMLGDSGASATAAGDEDLAEFIKPEDPVEDPATVKDPVPDQALTGVIELMPTPVVPAITIREPIEVARPVTVAESGNWTGEFTPESTVDAAILQANAVAIGLAHGRGEIQAAPRVMPYCVDDETPAPKMEYAIEDIVPDVNYDEDDDDGSDWTPAFWSFFLRASDKHPCNRRSAAQDPADCREDEHCHDHYPGCPFTGCPATGRCPPAPRPYVEPQKDKGPTAAPGGAEDNAEPPAPKRKTSLKSLREHLHKLTDNGEMGPLFPAVDTMEFRPSDHSPYERGGASPL